MHSTTFCLRKASPDKWTGKKRKPEFGRGNKNKAGKRQQELDGRNLSLDLVYRNNEANRAEDTGKLRPKWEGPYEVTEALGKGSYRLKDRNGKELLRTWNVCNLKKCYIHKM
ncbi:hypothetical protein Tco_0374344 [Tanacetum coccineum]